MVLTSTIMLAILLVGTIFSATAFNPLRTTRNSASFRLQALTWQEEVDQFLNIDTACDNRRELFKNLLSKTQEIVGDVASAVQEKDIKKIAPPSLGYGKAVIGLQAVRRQIVNDIIPEALTKSIPKLIQEGPKILKELSSKSPGKSQDSFQSIREMTSDPSQMQTFADDLRKELRNVVKSTPEGLDGPTYKVIKNVESYQIRFYSDYSVCSTQMAGSEGSEMPDALMSGNSFTDLADYVFGEKFAMTTPVICGGGAMEFVLPEGTNSENAPVPKSDKVTIKDIKAGFLAVKEFPGFATDGEVSRQRAMLEDSLLADGVIYDNLSFKVFQYNPPYTLPWLRRNEVSLSVEMSESDIPIPEVEVNPELIFSPEAGE